MAECSSLEFMWWWRKHTHQTETWCSWERTHYISRLKSVYTWVPPHPGRGSGSEHWRAICLEDAKCPMWMCVAVSVQPSPAPSSLRFSVNPPVCWLLWQPTASLFCQSAWAKPSLCKDCSLAAALGQADLPSPSTTPWVAMTHKCNFANSKQLQRIV